MIDTHCHLDDDAYKEDLNQVIQRAKQAGIKRILVPGVDEQNIQGVRNVCKQLQGYALPAIGIHPENITDEYQKQLSAIQQAIEEFDDWVAVGEIGLDYHYDATNADLQHEVFEAQLEFARQADLPVMIHSRDATMEMEQILAVAAKQGNRGVVHCFSGSYETARKYLDYGWKLGIGGVLTFKNSKLAEVIQRLPLQSLVLETDGPYLAPTPHRGERNESSYIPLVVARLAEIYRTTPQEIEHITDQTATKLFNLNGK